MGEIIPFIQDRAVVLGVDSSVRQAAIEMAVHGVGAVVVADHLGHIVGLITDRDIVCRFVARSERLDRPLAHFMTWNPVYVDETATIEDVIRLMELHGVRRIPVIRMLHHGRRECIGVVSLDDLVAAGEIPGERIAAIVRAKIGNRLKQASGRAVTEDEFYEVIASGVGTDVSTAANLARVVLGALVRQLHHCGAIRFVQFLPEALQDELLDVPAEPGGRVSARTIISELMIRFGMPQPVADFHLVRFCTVLEDWIGKQRFSQVKAALSIDLQALFLGEGPEADRYAEKYGRKAS